MKRPSTPGVALFVVGVVFLAVGSSGQRGLLGIGAAFIVIGLVLLARQRQGGSA
jgi:membrane-bound ClpP family serine protease